MFTFPPLTTPPTRLTFLLPVYPPHLSVQFPPTISVYLIILLSQQHSPSQCNQDHLASIRQSAAIALSIPPPSATISEGPPYTPPQPTLSALTSSCSTPLCLLSLTNMPP